MMIQNFCRSLVVTAVLISASGGSAQVLKTPDLIGLFPDSARLALSDDSLKLRVLTEEVYTDSFPEGVIAWQNPLPDSFCTDSIEVRLTAPLSVKFPDILGLDGFEAKALLDSLGLSIYPLGTMESEKYPYGTIAETLIKPDSMVPRGTTVGVRVSTGKTNIERTSTSGGVEVRLFERPEFKITSVSLGDADSLGFILVFDMQVTSPYPHAMTAEKFKIDFKLNDVKITHTEPDVSISILPKGTAKGKASIPVAYAEIGPAAARSFLGKATFRLVGTYRLKVEPGATQKPFDARGEFQVFAASSSSKTRLEEIAAGR